MTLDRAWPRRPLVSPPPFGKSIPAIWAETQVTIERPTPARNATGGFDGRGMRHVATVWAHVEMQTDSGTHIDVASGPIMRRYYTVIIPPDIDYVDQWLGERPLRGDRLTFVDPAGVTVTSPVKAADEPEGLADHWELETERFE